jgi:hypothetical protein
MNRACGASSCVAVVVEVVGGLLAVIAAATSSEACAPRTKSNGVPSPGAWQHRCRRQKATLMENSETPTLARVPLRFVLVLAIAIMLTEIDFTTNKQYKIKQLKTSDSHVMTVVMWERRIIKIVSENKLLDSWNSINFKKDSPRGPTRPNQKKYIGNDTGNPGNPETRETLEK